MLNVKSITRKVGPLKKGKPPSEQLFEGPVSVRITLSRGADPPLVEWEGAWMLPEVMALRPILERAFRLHKEEVSKLVAKGVK